jgi:hypothetical protein
MKNIDHSINIGGVEIDARIYQKSGEGSMEFSIGGEHIAFSAIHPETLNKIEEWIARLRKDYQEHLLLKSFKEYPHYNQIYWNQ